AKRSKTSFGGLKKSSFLEELPTEIQHEIIVYCIESVGNMRLVKKTWNGIVLAALETPSILLSTNLRMEVKTFVDSVVVTVDISNRNSACFQQLRRLVENGTLERSDANNTIFHGIFNNSSQSTVFNFFRSISRQID
ncbi:hypothetical protein PFISCL1PPCAC_9366, partial [Pristionchus fissidentatus]